MYDVDTEAVHIVRVRMVSSVGGPYHVLCYAMYLIVMLAVRTMCYAMLCILSSCWLSVPCAVLCYVTYRHVGGPYHVLCYAMYLIVMLAVLTMCCAMLCILSPSQLNRKGNSVLRDSCLASRHTSAKYS